MNLKTRRKIINKLREEGLTLKEIGDKHDLTMERVRQILEKTILVCIKHFKEFEGKCPYCEAEEYQKDIHLLSFKQLLKEAVTFHKKDRRLKTILQKSVLVKTLKKEFNLNFNEIGRLLKRDRKCIYNLYNK